MTEAEVKKHLKAAEGFNKEGEAYVHSEYKLGDNPLIVAGDSIVVIRIIERIATRLAKICGQEFDDIIEAVKEMHDWDAELMRN